MSPPPPLSCPICGHPIIRPDQDACTECGLVWNEWLDREAPKLAMSRRTWWMLFFVFPLVFAVAPLLTARGAIMGARTFEASYLLTIPGFAGIMFLSGYYARAVGWRLARSTVRRGDRLQQSNPSSMLWSLLGFLVLLCLLILIYFVMIRLGFYWFVHPLRPVVPAGAPPVVG